MFYRKKKIRELKLKLREKKIGELIDNMLKSELEIHLAPITREYFILDHEKKISICISEDSVKVANHNYLYEVSVSANLAAKYIDKVRQKIQDRSTTIKKELFKNEIELIENIKNLYDE